MDPDLGKQRLDGIWGDVCGFPCEPPHIINPARLPLAARVSSPEGWFCLCALVAVWIQTDHFPSFLFWGHILHTPFGEGSLYSMLVTLFKYAERCVFVVGGFLCKHILLLPTSEILVRL